MTQVEANGIQIEYETFGETDSPALLLMYMFRGQI